MFYLQPTSTLLSLHFPADLIMSPNSYDNNVSLFSETCPKTRHRITHKFSGLLLRNYRISLSIKK